MRGFFLLLDEPEVHGPPPDPVVITRHLPTLGKHLGIGDALGGLAPLARSACTRFGIFHTGVASAEDP